MVLINFKTKLKLKSVVYGMERNGSHVKELNMIHGFTNPRIQVKTKPGEIKTKTRERLYAKILNLGPNLSSITTSSEFALILSKSIHLACLTCLTLHRFELSVPEDVAQLIRRASSLAELTMYNYRLAHGTGDVILDAMALSPSLRRLNLDYCNVLTDELFAMNEWMCPLTHLRISDDDEPLPSMASTLRTSLSYLAPSLLDLNLALRFEIYDLISPDSISLPHLTHLTLIYEDYGIDHVELIPSLFDDSPLHTLTLISHDPWSDLKDLDVLRPFVRVHQDTLKFIILNTDCTKRADGRSLAAFAEGFGVVIVDCSEGGSEGDPYDMGDEENEVDEEDEVDEEEVWEDEWDGGDGDDEDEWEDI
jgi:hypothetical protein